MIGSDSLSPVSILAVTELMCSKSSWEMSLPLMFIQSFKNAPITVFSQLRHFTLDCSAYLGAEKCCLSLLSFWRTLVLHRSANSSIMNSMCSTAAAACAVEFAHPFMHPDSSSECCAFEHSLVNAISADCKSATSWSVFLEPAANVKSAPCCFCFRILESWQLRHLVLSYPDLSWKAHRCCNQSDSNCFIIESYWQFADVVFAAGLYIIQNNIISAGAFSVVSRCHCLFIFAFRFETECHSDLAA